MQSIKGLKQALLDGRNLQDIVDLILVMIVLVAVKQFVLPHSFLLAGPASTLSAMILATWLLWRRGLSWSKLGLRRPKNLRRVVVNTAITFFTIALVANISGWFAGLFFDSVGDSNRFAHIEGNLMAFLFILLLVWTHGSFFEELLFRAFMIDKASSYFGGGLKADLAAALLSSIFFGYRHYYYQGFKGAIVTGSIGFGLSLLYLWFGRKNIIPLILGHGFVNTLSQAQRFLGDSGN